MNLKSVRRLAASILKVGENRVWIDPSKLDKVKEASDREDVRKLIHDEVIRARPKKGVSRARVRARKGKRRGPGSRKGTSISSKEEWIIRIRAIRRLLRKYRDEGVLSKKEYRVLYRMAKGGCFKSKAHLMQYIESMKMMQK